MTDEQIYTPVQEATAELRRRRRNPELLRQVCTALGGDIPRYLLENECFVLSRHIATPNNEALYVFDQAARHGATAIFSQDLADKFTSVNTLKRRLARPEVYEARDGSGHGCFRKVDLVDMASAENLCLGDVATREGSPLASFHNGLFARLGAGSFRVVDDRDWIDRNHRGRMMELYERYLEHFRINPAHSLSL
jgi:hypothetical protein